MPYWARTVLKWTAAIVALVAVVAYSAPRALEELRGAVAIDMGEDDEEPEMDDMEVPTPEVQSGQIRASFDLSERNGTIQQVTTEQVVLGDGQGQQMLVAFEPVPADTACITSVVLEVLVHETVPVDLDVRAAQHLDVTALSSGEPLEPDTVIEGVSPVRAISDGSPGWLRWEIAEIYTLAAREAPSDLVVLAVATDHGEAEGEPGATVLGAVEGGEEQAALITWEAVVGCGGLTPEGQDGMPGEPDADLPGAPEDEDEPATEV
jgi:hypothetical protein